MLPAQAPTAYVGTANVIAVLILLAEFGMFRQALLRDQIRLYAAQSVLIAGLAVLVAAVRHLPELYVLAAVTVALKAVGIPLVLRRLLRRTYPVRPGYGLRTAVRRPYRLYLPTPEAGHDIAGSGGLSLASTILIGIVVAAFGFFSAKVLPVSAGAAPVTALSISLSVVLVAFVLMIHRRDVASQAIGLFSLENGISLAALVIAASLPLILEVALLFDLLLAVAVFGLLIRLHHGRADTLSTAGLTELQG
jgi:hydrogenase-4 component E